MDYDDNDFQGQSLHLAGEGSSKFSPVLHPYALSKFDFDDGLQSHLRFDSLVENEVFLGIPSQEDNQWIEDFARGSSAIEFSSSAAESCSISRRNNVWSEATSSESVEMLLKSVGQEEMVPGDTIIGESDACGELGGLTEGMEHNLKQDDEPKNGMDLDPGRVAVFLNPSVTSETHVIIGTEGFDRNCDDTNQVEVDSPLDDSHNIKLWKNSPRPELQIDGIDSSLQDIAAASVQLLKTQEPEHPVSENSTDNMNGLLLNTVKPAKDQWVLGKEADVDGRILEGIDVSTGSHNLEDLHCPSEVRSIEQHMVGSGISNIEEIFSLPPKGESSPHMSEGCSEELKSRNPVKASKCVPADLSHFHRQFKENMHEDVVVEGDSNIEGNDIEVITIEDGIPSSSEPKIDKTTFGETSIVEGKAYLQESDNQLGSKASVSSSEASLMPGVDNKLFDVHGDGSSNHVGDLLSLTIACSSTELIGKHAVEDLGLGDASGVHNEDSNAEDHALSPIVAGSVQTYEGTIVSNSNEMQFIQDVSFEERENTELPNDLSTTDSDIVESLSSVKRVEPLSEGDGMKVDTALAHESECLTTARNEPVVGAPLLCGTGAAADKGSDHLDKSTKIGRGGSEDTNLSSLKESSQGASELCPVLQAESGVSQRSTGKLLHKDFDQSRPTLETSNLASGIEQSVESVHKTSDQSFPVVDTCITSRSEQAVKAKESGRTSSCKLEVCLTLSDSAVKEGGCAEGLVPGNREEADLQKNHEAAPSIVAGENGSADYVKPDFGTPTVSSFVLSQNEEEKEGVQESTSGNVTFTEVSVQSTSHSVSGDNSAKDESIHPSAVLSEREATKDGESVSAIQTCKKTMIVEGSPSTPIVVQMDIVSELSRGSSQAPDGEIASGGSEGTPDRKTRRTPGWATRKENPRRGSRVKETTPGNVQYCGIPTSNLPDLNTSAPSSSSFHQAFTDLQQVQLRAQIFVYGSLIQRTAPDEACMVSAFGASDGGRSVWEPVWRSFMERIQGQKPHPNKSESPVQPRSGARPSDKPIKRGAHQSKLAPSPLGQASSKGTPSPVSNSTIPLSSPLWNISTPCDGLQSSGMPRTGVFDYQQTLPPIHPLQTPPTRGFVGHNWLSQTYFPGPWVASPQTSAFDANARLSLSPMTEAVKLTPVKGSSGLVTSEAKHASPITLIHSSGPGVVAETSSLYDMKKTTVLPTLNSISPKARKRKKVNVFEDLGRISLLAQAQTESVPSPVFTNHLSTSVIVSTPNLFPSEGGTSKLAMSVAPSSSTDQSKTVEPNPKQNTMSEDTLSKVEEANSQAEDAETLAAAAVSHSLSVWSQLDKHKNSGLSPDVEGKLASAAVAVAAAASVAKAAAAAAKIASNAALQAKMMADEALASGRTSNPAQSTSLYAVNNFGNTSPASILMGGNVSTSSSSMLVAAKEAARKRVEAASAASKQAENLDAILKAAELAAEAVSQAGKIVAMGDPFPLSKLVEAGPEGYWRVPQLPPEQGVISNNGNREQSKVHSSENCANVAEERPSEEAKTVYSGLPPLSGEVHRESMEDHVRVEDGLSSSLTTREADSRAKRSRRALDVAKTIGVVPESEVESRAALITPQDEYEKVGGTVEDNSMKEGCLVEVLKYGDGFKTAWFSANVLSLKDRKAFVSYTELLSDEGSGKLREWVELEGEANNAPTVRIAHHITTTQFQGTRKRRRAAMGDYQWLVGDRVDVWMQDCWCEGVLTEKNKKDETILMAHFPAEGETSVVKSWHLRPTLIWKDGEWIEWSRPREKDPSSAQGDTPREKRLKLGTPAIKNRENDKQSKNIDLGESEKPDESRLLLLSANDKVFNIGTNIEDQNKPSALRTLHTDLQKEGSRVVLGVAKPGKKRKFMEVSKHYVAEKSGKTNESNDSFKFTKYLIPQGSGPRGWKNTKIVGKEKPAAESKTKVVKSEKSLSVFGRTLSQKDKASAQNDGPAMNHMFKDSGSTVENVSRKQSLMEFGSFSKREGSAESKVLFSSLAHPSDAPSKKTSTSNARSERGNGRKLAHYSGKLATSEVDKLDDGNPGKSISEGVEPRRSNRRIQPTSRLLEGLQSSLVIPKFPAVLYDKSHRSQNRGGTNSKGNNHG